MLKMFLGAALAALAALPLCAQKPLTLHEGDRVVFYGDSITAQRLYSRFTEDIFLTRYPTLNVNFYNAGMGSDKVGGGGAGNITTRLERDVIALHPTVVTIMLGMNDANYRDFDPVIAKRYEDGYRLIVRKLKASLPEVRLYLIQPSPYDEINHPPKVPGYNSVLIAYGQILSRIAKDEGASIIDGNTPIVEELQRGKAVDPVMAAAILPDRVHPEPIGHWILAAAIAQALGVDPVVNNVAIDAKAGTSQTRRATVSNIATSADGTVTWTELDEALPLPLNPEVPATRFLYKISDIDRIDQQTLRVTGLAAPTYALTIDTLKVGDFSAAELAKGVNLSGFITPMLKQALESENMAADRANIDAVRFSFLFQGRAIDNHDTTVTALREFEAFKWKQEVDHAQPKVRAFHLSPTQ